MNIREQIAAWTVKAAELKGEAAELERMGQTYGAAKCREDARNVREHIERLKQVSGLTLGR